MNKILVLILAAIGRSCRGYWVFEDSVPESRFGSCSPSKQPSRLLVASPGISRSSMTVGIVISVEAFLVRVVRYAVRVCERMHAAHACARTW
ncbi:hypothetical protein C4D60_Mb02t05810 [Musa balbisiana]|uniref:Secreted protein n=1 Tax=Musa balbisiana TaxID=52838 RepID=A0A4S8I8J1_MUSBA|nr:hypothetical protein C4D60_Mb02t05810 [Musa balbisiana]